MASSELKRKTFFFLTSGGILAALLLLLPFLERIGAPYLAQAFDFIVGRDGTLGSTTGESLDLFRATLIEIIVNVLHVAKIFLAMALVIVVVRYIGFLIVKTALGRTGQSEIAGLTKTVLSIVIYIVAFFIIFQSQYPNVDLGALFTGSTIIGIVVGLALQDTLGNLFAGIAMQADQPFGVGDVVNISNRGSGVVESVSWRGVRLRTFQNKLLIISNAALGKETIEVAPRDGLNARLVNFSTVYSDAPAKTALLVREAVRQVENVSNKIRPIVRIRALGDSGIEWEIKYWAEDYSRYNDTDALIRTRLWYLFNREGIEFAYPTRTLYMQPAEREPDLSEYYSAASEQIVRVPIFAPLSQEEIDQLAEASKKRIFAPGETIVRSGAEGNSMFVITRGAVSVKVSEHDGLRTINRLQVNDFFGEMSLLTGQPRTATVVADEETEVIEIRKRALKPIIEANPELAEAISNMVSKRRELLDVAPEDEAENERPERGVLFSLKRFFGLDQ